MATNIRRANSSNIKPRNDKSWNRLPRRALVNDPLPPKVLNQDVDVESNRLSLTNLLSCSLPLPLQLPAALLPTSNGPQPLRFRISALLAALPALIRTLFFFSIPPLLPPPPRIQPFPSSVPVQGQLFKIPLLPNPHRVTAFDPIHFVPQTTPLAINSPNVFATSGQSPSKFSPEFDSYFPHYSPISLRGFTGAESIIRNPFSVCGISRRRNWTALYWRWGGRTKVKLGYRHFRGDC